MIRPFDIVRPTSEFVDRELTRLAMSTIRVDQGDVISVTGEFMDTDQLKSWLKAVGIVTETDGKTCHIEWFDKHTNLKNAWWDENDLLVVNNLAVVLCDAMAHPFGANTEQGEKFYGHRD